ncbi:hypothetical protein BGZ63DRAFT_428527 [Mariannaea sp. PMI_226]|nr:hypothetical protein BGZ63DRAFT_428527 [Mariannaea sp. PMI_226]
MSSDIGGRNSVTQRGDSFRPRAWYKVDRSLILDLLPRLRHDIRHMGPQSLLDLDYFFPRAVTQNVPSSILYDAFRYVFAHLEEHSSTGFLNMFELAERQLDTNSNRSREAIRDWGALMHAVCVMLDSQNGLGCSPVLLRHIMDFLEKLFPRVHHILGDEHTMVLFYAFMGIFEYSGGAYQREQLERIWNGFNAGVQTQLLRDMRDAMNVECPGTRERMRRLYGILTSGRLV